jgi:plasmid stabilization system protein ParE
MTYRLKILRQARREAEDIFEWLSERSPPGAIRWWHAFETAARTVPTRPLSYPLAPESEFVDYEVRHFAFKTRRGRLYRALFTIDEDEIRVLHIRGPGQDTMRASELGPPDDG